MSEPKLLYQGKELVFVSPIEKVLDNQGKTLSDLFNNTGALLVGKGCVPPAKAFSVPVYTYQDSYREIYPVLQPVNSFENDDLNPKEILKRNVGKRSLDLYESSVSELSNLLSGVPFTKEQFSTAQNIVGSTFTKNRKDLHTCLMALRTVDSYTYNHSFSVYLLFAQAMDDFRQHINEDSFWDIFKTSYSKINFNPEYIKLYCAGALLHDYGKVRIEESLLKKKDPLLPEERALMEKHPAYGVEALEKAGLDNPHVLEIVGNHHGHYLTFQERGQNSLAVITNILDIYDACRAVRPYKKAFSLKETLKILSSEKKALEWPDFLYSVLLSETIPKFEKE